MRITQTALLGLSLSTSICSAAEPAAELPRRETIVIAHRGLHRVAPENSLAGIEGAIRAGCDYVEVDVRTTSDGRLAHNAGVEVWVDALGENDTPQGFKRALKMGVDAIQTDRPEELIHMLKKAGKRRRKWIAQPIVSRRLMTRSPAWGHSSSEFCRLGRLLLLHRPYQT